MASQKLKKSILCLLVVSVCLAGVTRGSFEDAIDVMPAQSGKKVGFYGGSYETYHDSLVSYLENLGYVPLKVSRDTLSNVDAVYWDYRDGGPDLVPWLRDYVHRGGGLWIAGEAPSKPVELLGVIVLPKGIEVNSGELEPRDISPHEVTEGVHDLVFPAGSALSISDNALPILSKGNDVFCAVAQRGYGKIVWLIDSDMFGTYFSAEADNRILARNIVEWLSGPNQVAFATTYRTPVLPNDAIVDAIGDEAFAARGADIVKVSFRLTVDLLRIEVSVTSPMDEEYDTFDPNSVRLLIVVDADRNRATPDITPTPGSLTEIYPGCEYVMDVQARELVPLAQPVTAERQLTVSFEQDLIVIEGLSINDLGGHYIFDAAAITLNTRGIADKAPDQGMTTIFLEESATTLTNVSVVPPQIQESTWASLNPLQIAITAVIGLIVSSIAGAFVVPWIRQRKRRKAEDTSL